MTYAQRKANPEGAVPSTAQGDRTRRKSGSETRRRTEILTLRLLPSEQAVLRTLADQGSHRSVQACILELIKPHLDNATRLQTTDSCSS